jgi:hypothetical protein
MKFTSRRQLRGKTIMQNLKPVANTTTNEIELPKGCKLAEFCPILA